MSDFRVIVPSDVRPMPEQAELSAAALLSEFFRCDVCFIKREVSHTADVRIGFQEWEIKSPLGQGKRTIQHQLERGKRQSSYLVVDARRCPMRMDRFEAELRRQFLMMRKIHRLLLIKKDSTVVELFRK